MDASDEKDFTAGINSLWHQFELGDIFAHNKIDKFSAANYTDICDDNCWIAKAGDYDIHTLHASWQLPNIMDMKNLTSTWVLTLRGSKRSLREGTNMKMPVTVGVCVLNTFSDTIKAHFMQALSLLN
ncbi:hypothetical protein PHDIMM138B_27885 [Phytobacter diazotrophicus]